VLRWLTGRLDAIATEQRAQRKLLERVMIDYTALAAQVAKTADVEESAAKVIATIGADLAAMKAQLLSQGADVSAVADMQSRLSAATNDLASAIASTPAAPAGDQPSGSADAPAPGPGPSDPAPAAPPAS
jgi:hypothetical protein